VSTDAAPGAAEPTSAADDGDHAFGSEPGDLAAALLAEQAPPGSLDGEPDRPATPDEDLLRDAGAIEVLRRGLAVTPELRQGIVLTLVMAAVTAAGKLAVPILIQQILDRGVLDDEGFQPAFVLPACGVAAVLVSALYFVGRATYLRLVRAAEASLLALRVRWRGSSTRC
jgi:hypothetical protein